jgi:hypothetical protein
MVTAALGRAEEGQKLGSQREGRGGYEAFGLKRTADYR